MANQNMMHPVLNSTTYLSNFLHCNFGSGCNTFSIAKVGYFDNDHRALKKRACSLFIRPRVRDVLIEEKLRYTISKYCIDRGTVLNKPVRIEQEIAVNEPCVFSITEMIAVIKSSLGLSTSNIATIIGVSRATVYNHMSSGTSVNLDEYYPLFELAKDVQDYGWDVSRGLKSVAIEGKSLYKHLHTRPFNKSAMLNICYEVSKKLEVIPASNKNSVKEEKLASLLANKF